MTPDGRIRAGFVGGGFMAEVHSRAAVAARAQLAGVVSSTTETSATTARRLGFERAYGSVEELLADASIDVVHIVAPNATHFPVADAAIAAGKHVICEKPLTTNLDDATTLVTAIEASGLRGSVPFVYRYHPMVREARARVLRGETGRLLSISGSYLQDWLVDPAEDDWRVDEGRGGPSRAFADIGSHLADLVEFVTDERIERVQAVMRIAFDTRTPGREVTTEDLAAVLIETSGGAIGTLLVSQVAPGRKNRLHLEISGTAESISFDQENPETLWIGRSRGSELLTRGPELSPDAARLAVLPPGHPLGYQDAFNAFVADSYAAVNGAEPEGLPTFRDGSRAVAITEAVLASADSGGWTAPRAKETSHITS
ncbi:MAG TPA: Gfo/Idh/MocA family oxidoreductase [Pseudolysinimonas sp.]